MTGTMDRQSMMMQIFSYDVPTLWFWGALAAFLLVSELVTGTFVMVFLAIGALATGVVAEVVPMPFSFQLIVFGAIAVGSLFAGRGFIKKRLAKHKEGSDLAGPDRHTEFVLDQSIEPKGQASVSYQGAPWTAVNVSEERLDRGVRVKVIRTEGIKLLIEKA